MKNLPDAISHPLLTLSGDPQMFSKQTPKEVTYKTTKNPDVIIKHKFTGETFAVECKYRSEIRYDPEKNIHYIQWSTPEQITRYKNFSKTENTPVFIVIGIGGNPKDPEHVFCIALNDIKYPKIYESIFEKIPKKSFMYRNGILF
ncbi:MAG TPA: hypothetical protein O0W89_01830 [Methanocorpusculum sp.]|nr:hypothetical protein [Methanocorpusculum sp.]